MGEALQKAKTIAREGAEAQRLWIRLSLLQDLIAELEAALPPQNLRDVARKLRAVKSDQEGP